MAAGVVAWVVAANAAFAQVQPRIVNGVPTVGDPAVGALLCSTTSSGLCNGNDPGAARIVCSGTMIGCSTFLTAAHCLAGDLHPAHHLVFLPHAGFFALTSVAVHPSFAYPEADVAVLELALPEEGIRPSAIDTGGGPPFGSPGIIAGFGRTGGGSDYGIKRSGAVETVSCVPPADDATSVCWQFLDPIGAAGTDSNTCNGDSGGPLFVGGVLAGVTSGGASADCTAPDAAYDAKIAAYASWIQAEGGADVGVPSCGNVAQVGDAGAKVFAFTGSVTPNQPRRLHGFSLPAGMVRLVVTFNGVDDGANDFDLYVRRGAAPTVDTFDCSAAGSSQFGACRFDGPAGGTWYAMVDRYAGGGEYQLTATAYGVDCGDAGNDGMACDDGNPCTDNDRCLVGACTGSPAAEGASCSDGNPCTHDDACASGLCVGLAGPVAGCRGAWPGGSRLVMRADPAGAGRQRVKWVWAKGESTVLGDLGDPTAQTAYDLCVFGSDGLLYHAPIAPGGPWRRLASGFGLRDPGGLNAGIAVGRFTAGPSGGARLLLRGKGADVTMGASLVVPPGSTVTTQLYGERPGPCWTASYSTPTVNDGTVYRSRSD